MVATRMNENEYLIFMENRDKSGLGTTAFVRDMLLNGKVQQRMPIAYYDLIAAVNRIGVNINQIARVANASKYTHADDMRECVKLLQEIKSIVAGMTN